MSDCKTILVVDDEPAMLDIFLRCLRWAEGDRRPVVESATSLRDAVVDLPGGRRVLLARSGEDALQLVKRELSEGRYVAGGFFDLKLGQGMDGLDTIRRLRELEVGLLCTVVTGYDDRSVDEINRLFLPDHSDDWDYMSKPFTRWEVAQKARQMTASWNRRRREAEQGAEIRRLNGELECHGEELERRVEQRTSELAETNGQLERRKRELEDALEDLASTESRLLQLEKMGSIGQLAAGVAQAVTCPLGFISANLATLEGHLERLSSFVEALSAVLDGKGHDETAPGGRTGALAAVRVAVAKSRQELRVDYVLDDAPQLVSQSREGLHRIRSVAESLSAFSRPGGGDAVPVDVNAGLRASLSLASGQLADGAELDSDLGDVPAVTGRPSELNQVWMSLLANAVDAVRELGTAGRIRVSTGVCDDGVSIEVRDNGSGMSKDVAFRVFEPFYTTKAAGDGSGLGLSVAYGIVRRHGGEITIQSSPGEGARFIVRLPVAPAAVCTTA